MLKEQTSDLKQQLMQLNPVQRQRRLISLLAGFHRAEQLEPHRARNVAQEALILSELVDDTESLARSRRQLGLCHFRLNEFPEALYQLQKAQRLFEQLGDKEAASEVLLALGTVYTRIGDHPQALDHYRESLRLSDELNLPDRMVVGLSALGNLHADLDDYVAALEYYFEALKLSEQTGNEEIQGISCSDIGFIYAQVGEYSTALEYFTRSLECFRRCGNKYLEVQALSNIGAIHASRGELEEAINYGLRTLVIYDQLGDRPHLAEALVGLAAIYERSDRLDAAMGHLSNAFDIAVELENDLLQATALIGMANLYRRSDAHWNAVAELDRAIPLVQASGNQRLELQIHEQFSKTFEELGDSAKALDHFKLATMIKEELQGEKKRRAIAEFESRFALEKIEQERERYRRQASQLETELENKTRELAAMTLNVVKKDELLDTLRNRISHGSNDKSGDSRTDLRALLEQIEAPSTSEEAWKEFERQLDSLNKEFFRALSERGPKLTPTELRVCSLVKANLTTKEIAELLCASERTIENHRYRIRKKLELPVDINLTVFLSSI